MNNFLLKLSFIFIISHLNAYSSQKPPQDAVSQYFRSANVAPPNTLLATCTTHCAKNCDTDIINKSFNCLQNCWDKKTYAKLYVCAQKQFAKYVEDIEAELRLMSSENAQQAALINNLQDQIQQANLNATNLANKVKFLNNPAKAVEIGALRQKLNKGLLTIKGFEQRVVDLVNENKNLKLLLADAQAKAKTQAQNIDRLKLQVNRNKQQIQALTQEVGDMYDLLDRLLREEALFVGKVNEVTKLFEDKKDALLKVSGDYKTKIADAQEILRKYREELSPYIASKEQELQQIIDELKEHLRLSNEFMVELEGTMNDAKANLDRVKLFN